VARLAIAKGFLGEYAKLDKDVQSAVDAAIAAFARHPHPGQHLEKPRYSRDDRIRLMPVDARWRGVILAPPATAPADPHRDTYCLVTVLPQDKANAYAASRRFSVNRALGVMEVRDEEAIQNLRPAAEPAGGMLFADVSDADLARLGVDPQLLPTARSLTSETDLEAVREALPQGQYAALHALAGGMTVDEALAESVRLVSGAPPPARVDPDDLVSAMERAPGQVTFVSGPEELRHILAHPFAAWRTFLHPSQRDIAYQPSYAGPAQVTGGPGTGKTVTVLHRAALLAERATPAEHTAHTEPVLLTTFNGNLAHALAAQLDLLVRDAHVRQKIEVLNVDRLAYRIVRQARGTPVIADERMLRDRWAKAVAEAGSDFTPAFGKNEWEQVILAQDLRTEQAYLTCPRTGRGRPLSKVQRGQVWRVAQLVTAELAAARQATHLQLADEATRLLRQAGAPRYRHILVDEAQDLHPAQWRLLRAAVAPGPDDLFIAADPHQRVYENRVSLASLRISVRGRSRRLALNYRTTQEILAWAVPLLGTDPVTGLDGEVDSLLGYRSPMHGPRPERRVTAARAEEFKFLAERIGSWLSAGLEPSAIGVAARSAGLVREAREALAADGIATVSLSGRGSTKAVRTGTMHAMKGLEFQAVAVIGVEQGLVPAPAAITPETEDAATHAQDLQRERCVLFVACTRARDHLYVSGTGEPSIFLPSGEVAAPPPPEPDDDLDQILPAASLPRLFRLLLSRRRLDPGLTAESFLAWATAPGRRLRLADLDAAARQFLTEGGDRAVDLADRCLDLLDRLAARDPDLAGVRLPRHFADAARKEASARFAGPHAPGPQASGPQASGPHAPGPHAPGHSAARRAGRMPPRPRLRLDPDEPAVQVVLPAVAAGLATWQLTADGDPATVRSRAGAPPAAHPLTRPVRAVHVGLAGWDHVTELDVVPSCDPVLFFAADGSHLPPRLPLPPDRLWILRPAGRELVAAGELRTIRESPAPSGWEGWCLELVSLEKASSVALRGGPAHAVPGHPRPRLLLGEPLPGVTTLDGSPAYQEPPRLWLPGAVRWHVGIRPAAGGISLVSREISQAGPADIWDGVPRPILGEFGITVRGPLGRGIRTTIFVAEGARIPDPAPPGLVAHPWPRPRPQPSLHPQLLASGAEIASGRLMIRDPAQAGGLAAALYLARAPWRPPVVVPVPADGVVTLPPGVCDAGPLLVQLRAEDPWTVTNWPDWPGRAAWACPAPGIPVSADQEEDALSRFLARQRDLPVRPHRVERLWRLLHLAADLIAAGAPADLRERCSAALRNQPGLAMTGLLDAGLDAAACVAGLVSTGLATARPIMMDDMHAAERLWGIVPAAAAVLSSRLLAGPTYPDEDPTAVVLEAALAQCGPSLDAVLGGAEDPHAQVGRFGPDAERLAADQAAAERPPAVQAAAKRPPVVQAAAKRPPAVVVPQPLLDADTRAAAAAQLFAARLTPELARAAQDATSVVGSAERLVAATPYRRAVVQVRARHHPGGQGGWLALPAMSASLALVARIAARGDEDCRSFERAWRARWTDLARQAPDLTSIDLVLAEAHVAATERARFA